MRYQGGKGRVAKGITRLINMTLRPGQTYLEPFCGMCWVVKGVRAKKRIASDANVDVILMWQALITGWQPPMGLSEGMYQELKESKEHSPLRGFAGSQLSYGGVWFSGYARGGTNSNYAHQGRRGLMKDVFKLRGVDFSCRDYREWTGIEGAVIYCDPPYEGTAGYEHIGKFDHAEFWDVMRLWSQHNLVFISEYKAPPDFMMCLEIATRTGLKDADGKTMPRMERVFTWKRF